MNLRILTDNVTLEVNNGLMQATGTRPELCYLDPVPVNKIEIEGVWVIETNSDLIEGRGPQRLNTDFGFFWTEEEAKEFAKQQPGIMGVKNSGAHVVEFVPLHDEARTQRKIEIETKIKALRAELESLQKPTIRI